jgi:uncharacterized protein YecT (DUF1311 family)
MLLMILALAADPCANATTQTAMNECAGKAYVRADAAMNRQWQRVYARAKASGATYAASVLAAQRAWLKFRDAECKAEGDAYAGGSMQPMVAQQCLATVSEARAKQLQSVASDQ